MFAVRLIPGFICKFLYIYAVLKCISMQHVMVNRKLCRIFGFSCMLEKVSYLITLRFFVCFMFAEFSRKRKQKRKNRIFAAFCRNMSVFVANKTLVFSDLLVYRANCTPPPPVFGTRRVGQLSSEIFYFLFFVKYYDFSNSAFLPNFEHF